MICEDRDSPVPTSLSEVAVGSDEFSTATLPACANTANDRLTRSSNAQPAQKPTPAAAKSGAQRRINIGKGYMIIVCGS
jgi:hypothetical protein